MHPNSPGNPSNSFKILEDPGRAQVPSRASADAAKDAKVLKFSVLILGDTKYSPECIMAWKWKWSLG